MVESRQITVAWTLEAHGLSCARGGEDSPAGTERVVGRGQPWVGRQCGGQSPALFLSCEPPLSFCVRDVDSFRRDVRSRREGVGECLQALKGGVQRQPRRHYIAGNLPAVHVPRGPVLGRRLLRQPVGGINGIATVAGTREFRANPAVLAVVAVRVGRERLGGEESGGRVDSRCRQIGLWFRTALEELRLVRWLHPHVPAAPPPCAPAIGIRPRAEAGGRMWAALHCRAGRPEAGPTRASRCQRREADTRVFIR